jgi:patatin-like phospholipase/acyl hydrolase
MSDAVRSIPIKRSAGALAKRREPLPWPEDRDFRILSIDGGGIKGIFPASVLAGIEERFLGGRSVARYFDLIAGTSTGGIIALGLAAGLTAGAIRDLYLTHGGTIFPSRDGRPLGGLMRKLRHARQLATHVYDRAPLEVLLKEALGEQLLGDAICRLNIPAFEGQHSEVYVFKTPHHPDFKLDRKEKMITAALATAAAPTFFRSLSNQGYVMVDGGVWANNPMMLAVVDALSCFDVDRHHVSVLSIGCGPEPFTVTQKLMGGGLWHWRKVISAAMHLQSQNAIGQARLLLGAERVLRLEPPSFSPAIDMDDYVRAKALLGPAAAGVVGEHAQAIEARFLYGTTEPYVPVAVGA